MTKIQTHLRSVFSSTPPAIEQRTDSLAYIFMNIRAHKRCCGEVPSCAIVLYGSSMFQITAQTSGLVPKVERNLRSNVKALPCDESRPISSAPIRLKSLAIKAGNAIVVNDRQYRKLQGLILAAQTKRRLIEVEMWTRLWWKTKSETARQRESTKAQSSSLAYQQTNSTWLRRTGTDIHDTGMNICSACMNIHCKGMNIHCAWVNIHCAWMNIHCEWVNIHCAWMNIHGCCIRTRCLSP